MTLRTLSLLTILVAAACGPAPASTTPSAHALRPLTEAQASQIIAQMLADAGHEVGAAFELDHGAEAPLEVDFRVGESRFGVEWISAQDREAAGESLPEPVPGQLRILPGAGEQAEMEILLLEETTYRYDPDRRRTQSGSRGLAEVEGRLRADLRDFLAYAR